jgi:hypothetical protein
MEQISAGRRRFLRCRTNLLLRIRNLHNRDVEGSCLVLGEGGLGGVLPEAIPVGSVVELQLALPTHPLLLETWAVVRSQLQVNHGFEFLSLKDDERLSVRAFCAEVVANEAT